MIGWHQETLKVFYIKLKKNISFSNKIELEKKEDRFIQYNKTI